MTKDFYSETPSNNMETNEYHSILIKFITFVILVNNKKTNLPSLFNQIFEDKELFDLYKKMCGFDDDIDAVREFLYFDESISKSKFIKKIVNHKQKK